MATPSDVSTPLERYDRPPFFEGTQATHFVHFPWSEEWSEESWQSVPELKSRTLGDSQEDDIVTTDCAILYDNIPSLGNAFIITRLSHKSLVIVLDERVGPQGGYHKVKVVATNPSINGTEGYVDYAHLAKLPGIPPSLPVNFKCKKFHDKNRDFCSLTVPQWFTTTEPYLDTFECKYKVNVVTEFVNTGGDETLKARMREQIPIGVKRLLAYYDKVRAQDRVDEMLNSFQFAEATSWNLDISDENSRLKVLVSVPAKYFDAIPDAPVDFSTLGNGVTKHATLLSSTVEKDIERLVKKMRSWAASDSWDDSKSTYNGPEPLYKEYDFIREAFRLERFLSGLRRLLVLNGKNLRPRSEDTIEIGMTDEYKIAYVILNDDMGSHKMRIGLGDLISRDPFNNQRTMAYVFYLYEISNEFKRSNGIKGGWAVFLKRYTFPPPDHKPAAKKKKCKPTLKDPLKCMPKEFKDFYRQHTKRVKCEDLPPEMKTTPLDLGASEINQLYNAIETGEWSGYRDRYKTVRTQAENIIAKRDIKEFKKKIRQENDAFGGKLDFVGDAFVEDLDNRLAKYSSPDFASELGDKIFDTFMTDVVVNIDIEGIVSKLHQCYCDQQTDLIDRLIIKFNDPDHPAVKAAEAVSASAGCRNPCEVLPILCSCLPIPWPLQFDIPAKFSIPDILRYLTAAIIDALITAAFKFLLDLIKGFISAALTCDRDSKKSKNFLNQFQSSYPIDQDRTEEIEDVLRKNEMPVELIDLDKINSLINETALLLTPREFCELISGDPSLPTLEAITFLINERYPDFKEAFSSHEKIRSLYSSIGDLIDPEICRNLDDLMTAVPIEPGSYICDETSIRDDISTGRATNEQIKEILAEASKCNQDKLSSIIDLVNNLVGGGNVMGSIMPEIFQTPANPNGIIPRDPPPVRYMAQNANDSIFRGIEKSFYSEMNSNIPTLITTTRQEVPPSSIGTLGAPNLQFLQSAGLDFNDPLNADLRRVLDRTIADGLGNILNNQIATLADYNSGPALLSMDLPERRIYPEGFNEGNYSAEDNLYVVSPIPGFGTSLVSNEPIRTEKIRIEYNICNETAASINWNRIRDAFTLRIQDTFPSEEDSNQQPIDLMTFDGKKKIKDGVVDLYEDFRTSGNFSPSRELFSNILSNQWLELPWDQGIRDRILANPLNPLNTFHSRQGFKFITTDIIVRMAKLFSKSRLLDAPRVGFLQDFGVETDFDTALENLKSINFVPDASCKPVEPGILNMDSLMQQVTEIYDNDLETDPSLRYINSAKYGLIVLMFRVFSIHTILNSLFAFSLFRAQDILKSDLLVSYLLNKFRVDMTTDVYITRSNFYRQMKYIIGVQLARRKYIDKEDFVDPFTGEPVDVRLDPRYVRDLVESTQHDPTGLIETIDLEQLQEEEDNYRSDNLESVLKCYVSGLDDFASDGASECVPQTESDTNNETSDGTTVTAGGDEALNDPEVAQPDVGAGKRPVGFMEFFFREQLRSISGEVEVMLGTEINDIDQLMINGMSKTTEPPSYYRGDALANQSSRFFKNIELDPLDLTRQEVGESGLGEILEIYDAYEQSDDRNGGLPSFLENLRIIRDEGKISRELFDRYRREISNATSGTDREIALSLILQDLVPVLESRSGIDEQSDFLKPEFKYLETGGFITEKYIRVFDRTEEEWASIVISGTDFEQFLYERIKQRPERLKGVVSLRDWEKFTNTLVKDATERFSPDPSEEEIRELLTNPEDYYEKWHFGKRMSYVYPLADESPRIHDFLTEGEEYLDVLRQDLLGSVNVDIAKISTEEKAYFLTETAELKADIQINQEAGELVLLQGQEIKKQVSYNVFVLPLIVQEEIVEENYFQAFDGDFSTIGSIRKLLALYHESYDNKLTLEMMQDQKYRALFEYVFPLDRFISLLTIYTAEHVAGLPGRKELFHGTKEKIFDMFESLQKSAGPRWWEKDGYVADKWWKQPLDLSVPGILFLTPWKILQALLILVPPLDWFLGKIKDKIPFLPPYKSNRQDPCPEDRAE